VPRQRFRCWGQPRVILFYFKFFFRDTAKSSQVQKCLPWELLYAFSVIAPPSGVYIDSVGCDDRHLCKQYCAYNVDYLYKVFPFSLCWCMSYAYVWMEMATRRDMHVFSWLLCEIYVETHKHRRWYTYWALWFLPVESRKISLNNHLT